MKKIHIWLLILFLVIAFLKPGHKAMAQEDLPHIISSTTPAEQETIDTINAWLETYAPAVSPFWAITAIRQDGESALVSLVELGISSADEEWTALCSLALESKLLLVLPSSLPFC